MESVKVFKTGDNANTEPSTTTLLFRSSNPGKKKCYSENPSNKPLKIFFKDKTVTSLSATASGNQ